MWNHTNIDKHDLCTMNDPHLFTLTVSPLVNIPMGSSTVDETEKAKQTEMKQAEYWTSLPDSRPSSTISPRADSISDSYSFSASDLDSHSTIPSVTTASSSAASQQTLFQAGVAQTVDHTEQSVTTHSYSDITASPELVSTVTTSSESMQSKAPSDGVASEFTGSSWASSFGPDTTGPGLRSGTGEDDGTGTGPFRKY